MRLPFDPDDPPADPPPGCVSPTIWRLAYALHADHRTGEGDRCRCGASVPCPHRRTAQRGFLEAYGLACSHRHADLLDTDPGRAARTPGEQWGDALGRVRLADR